MGFRPTGSDANSYMTSRLPYWWPGLVVPAKAMKKRHVGLLTQSCALSFVPINSNRCQARE